MKKRWMALALMCVLLLTLCACQQKPTETKVEEKKQGFVPALDPKVEASFEVVGSLSNFEALDAVINDFRAYYPNVSISYVKLDDYVNMVGMRLENDPNTALYLDGPVDHAENLTAHKVDVSHFGPVIKACTAEGQVYGLPLGIDVRGMVVNKNLLKQEGLEIPTNYAEFTAVCDALVQKGYTPIQQSQEGAVRNLMQNEVLVLITTADSPEETLARLKSGEKGSMEAMRPLVEMYESFLRKGYVSSEINSGIANDYEAAILNFFEGKTAFMPANSDTVSGMAKRESKSAAFTEHPFEYSFVYAPLGEKGIYSEQRAWRCLRVSKYAANKEVAVEFARYVATKEGLNRVAEVKGIPSASNEQEDKRFLTINDAVGTYVYSWEWSVPAKILNSVIGRTTEFSRGEFETVDEVLAAIEQDIAEWVPEQ